ncbi:MAG: IS1595 family transposase [Reyranellales bacterium]
MAKSKFKDPKFSNETAARAWFEAARWPQGPICPRCKSPKHYVTKKEGVYRCAAKECRKDFTVMTGTVMERSHAPLTAWALGFNLAASSKKGISAHQLHRETGVQYNTAWFMWHRIREAMARGGLELPPLGGAGKVVEVDETYFGGLPEHKRSEAKRTGRPWHRITRGVGTKRAILTLVERGGEARSFYVENAPVERVVGIVRRNIAKESRLHTDESHLYRKVGKEFADHESVVHSRNEYARGDVTTNTVEGFFGVFKRGMKGVYQHCDEKHLHRYLAEFDFRYKYRASLGYSDDERAIAAVRGGEGKRLTYRQPL